VYNATYRGCTVAVKTLKAIPQTDQEKLYRVSSLCPNVLGWLLIPGPQLLVEEVVGWKWLRHENILPFLGVLKPPLFSIISEQMENGNIIDFIRVHPNFNRLDLVSEEGRILILSLY